MRQTLEERSGLSPEKIDTLCAFGQALIEKNKVMNLTAITEPQAVAELHFLDSAALLQAADFQGKRVIDVGCGAGFPGVPLKIAEPSMPSPQSLMRSAARRPLRVMDRCTTLPGTVNLMALDRSARMARCSNCRSIMA